MRMFSLVRVFLGEENASLSGNDFAPGCLQQTNLYTPWGGSRKGSPCGASSICEAVVRLLRRSGLEFSTQARPLALLQLLALFLQNSLAAQLDLVAFERENLDQDLIAFFQLVPDILDPVLGDLTDVQQSVGAGEDLDKSPEIDQPDNFAQVGFAYFRDRGDIGHHLDRPVGRGAIGGENVYGAIVGDVDLNAGGIDDAADHLAAGTDQLADFVGRDGQGIDARSVLRHRLAWFRDHGIHLVENEQPRAASLLKRLLHNGGCDIGYFDIHLKARDAFSGTGDLEIHVAVMVFSTGDIGEDGIIVTLFN